jgi:hypothetical protein
MCIRLQMVHWPVRFGIEVPLARTLRLLLQFRHEDRVQTAAFTVEASEAGHYREKGG